MPRISRFRNLLAGTLRDTVPFAGGNSAAASRQAALLFDLQSWQGCHILEGSLNKGSTGSDRAPGRAFDEVPRSLRTTIVEDRATRPEEVGWGGRIRTFTVLINSEVSYQLDHAPAEL